VTYWIDRGPAIDQSKIKIEIPLPDLPPPPPIELDPPRAK
jgi:hypothetical protein